MRQPCLVSRRRRNRSRPARSRPRAFRWESHLQRSGGECGGRARSYLERSAIAASTRASVATGRSCRGDASARSRTALSLFPVTRSEAQVLCRTRIARRTGSSASSDQAASGTDCSPLEAKGTSSLEAVTAAPALSSGHDRVFGNDLMRAGTVFGDAAPSRRSARYGTNVTTSQPWNMKCMGPNSPRTQALISVPVNSDS